MSIKKQKSPIYDSILWLLWANYSTNFLVSTASDGDTKKVMPTGALYSKIDISYPPDKKCTRSNSYFGDAEIEKIIRNASASPDQMLAIKPEDERLLPSLNFDKPVRRKDFLRLRLNLAAAFYDLLLQAQTARRLSINRKQKSRMRSKIKLPHSVLRYSLWDVRASIRGVMKGCKALLALLGQKPTLNKETSRYPLDAHIVGRELIESILSNGIVPEICKQTFPHIQATLWDIIPPNMFGESLGEDIPDYWQRDYPTLLPFMMPWFASDKDAVKAKDAISFYTHLCDAVKLLYIHARKADDQLTEMLKSAESKSRNEGDLGFKNFFSVLCQTWELTFGKPVKASKDFLGFVMDVCDALHISVSIEAICGQIKTRKKLGAKSYASLHHVFDEMLIYNNRHIQTKVSIKSGTVADAIAQELHIIF